MQREYRIFYRTIPRVLCARTKEADEWAAAALTTKAVLTDKNTWLIDQKFTTRVASMFYGVWYLIALLLMIFMNGSMPMVVLATLFVGVGIGGIGNLIPSMIKTCFGRFGFLQANKIVTPINTVVSCSAFIVIGAVGAANLHVAYWIFFVLNLVGIAMMFFIRPKAYS